MKKKKLIIILSLSLVGNYFTTWSVGAVAYADKLNKIENRDLKTVTQGADIDFYNIWGGESVQLEFDESTMKINAIQKSGDLGNDTGTYMKLFYYNSKTNKVDINQNVKDGSATNLITLLNGKSFDFGDVIGVDYEENGNDPKLNNGETIQNDGKIHYFKITEQGLVPYTPNIEVNPFQVLTGEKVTEGIVTGTAVPNSKVQVNVNGSTFTGTCDSNGKFSVKVEDSDGFLPVTKVNVTAVSDIGPIEETVYPSLSKDVSLQNSSIQIINGWKTPAGLIQFNPLTMKFKVSQYNRYIGHTGDKFLNIVVYNPKEGKVKYSGTFNGDDNTSVITNLLNNQSFEYGDIIGISCDPSQGSVTLENGKTTVGAAGSEFKYYTITKTGLEDSTLKSIKVNPLNILGNGNTDIKNTVVTGIGAPNVKITALVDGVEFTGESGADGKFSIPISDKKGFNLNTNINVYAKGFGITKAKVGFEKDVQLQNSNINIIDHWNSRVATLGFNPITMQFNPQIYFNSLYLNPNSNVAISVSNIETGDVVGSIEITEATSPSTFKNAFEGKKFEYGDVIRVTTNTVGKGEIQILNGGVEEPVGESSVYYEITKQGLKPFNQELKVNSFDILDGENKTSGNVTGTAQANSEVEVTIGSQVFKGTTDGSGKFSILVKNPTPFTCNTTMKVWAKNCATEVIHPVAPANLVIGNETLQLKGEMLNIAEQVKFNPTTMKVEAWGSGIGIQFIDGNKGNVIASAGTGNINIFQTTNNINGQAFKYGDLINIYETKETYLSDGNIELLNGKETTTLNSEENVLTYRITPQGLIPVENKDLNIVSALYEGTQGVEVIAKAKPNENVTFFYGNQTKVVQADKDGNIKFFLPESEAPIGMEIRAFINNQNEQGIVVKYDPAKFNSDNSIQIVNNQDFPVINVKFNPLTHEINPSLYYKDTTYAGRFYGNKIKMNLINPKTGEIIKSVTNTKPADAAGFVGQLNNVGYAPGDIIEVEYDKNFVTANVFNNKKEIGNDTGAREYFAITDTGLVNVTNKFITVNPLDVLDGSKITSTTIAGKAGANSKVSVLVDGKTFEGTSDASGNFSIPIKDKNGLTNTTKIVVSEDGYIPTTVYPSINNKIGLNNSEIGIYQKGSNWMATNLAVQIGFDINNSTLTVQSFEPFKGGKGNPYFDISLYSADGVQKLNDSFTDSADMPTKLASEINGQKFEYGDIIGVSFNPEIGKPVVANGYNNIGNITGNEEYFKITKDGLVRVAFGNIAQTDKISWNGENLNISAKLGDGISQSLTSQSKKIVIVDSKNNVIESTNATLSDGIIQGELQSSQLGNIKDDEQYGIDVQLGDKLIPINIVTNTPSSSEYTLSGDSNNNLMINKKEAQKVTINNSDDISSIATKLTNNLNTDSNSNTIQNIEQENKYNITLVTFINTIGLKNLQTMYNASANNAKFINWVLNNQVAMTEFLNGPNPSGASNIQGQNAATYAECFQVWSNIWNTYTDSHYGFNLRLAIATSLVNGKEMTSFPSGRPVGSPVERYHIFDQLNRDGGMVSTFKDLDVSHLCYVVDTIVPNDEIMQMRNIILQNHNSLVSQKYINNVAYTINYNTKNPHTGASVFGNDFYGPNPTIADVWYDGGVCGAISRMGTMGDQMFGVPASQTPQPGHDAFIYYDYNTKTWSVGNDVFGWAETYQADLSGWSQGISTNGNITSYDFLYEAANNANLRESNVYLDLAKIETGYSQKLNSIKNAMRVQPLNLEAWKDLINLYKTNPTITIDDYDNLVNSIISTFGNYPQPMYDVLNMLTNTYLQKGTANDFNNFVKQIKTALQNATGYPQTIIAEALIKQMPKNKLVPTQNTLLTLATITMDNVWSRNIGNLSFDTQNNKIVYTNGGTGTNPYLPKDAEAFSISLCSKDGKVIKSVTVNGSEYPENRLQQFNDLSFEYGDTIVIDYKTSSKISIDKLITPNGVEDNYQINKPTTLYITPNGLSTTSDAKIQTGNATVKMDTDKGDSLGKEINLSGKCGTGIALNNVTIPEGYRLEKVLFNGKTIYTGSNLANAEYQIGLQNYSTQTASIELVLQKSNDDIKAEKARLASEIKKAQSTLKAGVSDGNPGYTSESTKAVTDAITNGNALLKNDNATSSQIKDEIKAIQKAEEGLKVNPSELKSAITKAQAALKKGDYTQESITALQNAIKAGQNLIAGNTLTLANVKEAIVNINTGINNLVDKTINNGTAKLSMETENGTLIKAPQVFTGKIGLPIVGNDLAIPSGYVLDKVLINGNTEYTGNNICDAQSILEKKMFASKETEIVFLVSADTEGLTSAITNAQSKLKAGNYTDESKATVQTAIANAQAVINNKNATPAEVKTAINNINTAVNGLVNGATTAEKTALTNEVKKAQNILTDGTKDGNPGYTSDSEKAVTDAINKANRALENKDATQDEINTAIKALQKAESGLRVNTKTLANTIGNAKTKIQSGNYTSDSKKALQKAIESAEKVMSNKTATPNEVKNATESLNSAVNGLVKEKTSPEKIALTNAITNAQNKLIDGSENGNPGYTDSSTKALRDAIQKGNEVLGNKASTTTNINNAIQNIKNAENKLVVNKKDLENNINKTNNMINNNSYKKGKKAKIQKNLDNAKKVLNNPNATPQMVKNAINNLKNPKTGDGSELPIAVVGLGALVGLFMLNRRKMKIKGNINKKNNL